MTPDENAPEDHTVHMRLHLAGGQTIDGHFDHDDPSMDPEEIAEELFEAMTNYAKPTWMRVGHIIVHTQAVHGIEVLG